MLERPQSGEQAILVHITFSNHENADLREFKELARAAGASIVSILQAKRSKPDATYFMGSGKVEELKELVSSEEANIVLFNHELSPAQERNIERIIQCRVLSRTGLILDIFAQRARTFEGKLQVELVQLQHLSTRLIRGYAHLGQQKGGIGLRGPGESQLETDRRLIRERIHSIEVRLEKVKLNREQARKQRVKAELPTVALVGYTNAGKSTIFNALTGSDVLVANQLFATLDPTMRSLDMPGIGKVILIDTVGFVRKLPHKLVNAFRATLEETKQATLLVHVVDGHDEDYLDTIEQVNEVLAEVGAEETPQLIALNKVDLLSGYEDKIGTIERSEDGAPTRVWLSALSGIGLQELRLGIQECLSHDIILGTLALSASEGAIRARLYELDAVLKESLTEEGWSLDIRLLTKHWLRLCHESPHLNKKLKVK